MATRTSDPEIPMREYEQRRTKLMRAIGKSVGLVFAGTHDDHLNDTFRPHPHFEYLTGVTTEPGAILMIDPSHPHEARRAILYLRPLNPELEQWDGLRSPISAALRDACGVRTIYRTAALGRFLNEAVQRSQRLVCLHPLAQYNQPISPDLKIFRDVMERVPGVTIEDATDAIAKLRGVKSAKEVAVMQRAIDITRAAFEDTLAAVQPGMSEFDVQETLEHGYRARGSRGPAFGTIVGSGVNSTVLHYRDNDRTIEDGDLICIDSGAAYHGYGADITRTIPANGTFSARQREVYNVVLAAMNGAIRSIKPGATLGELDAIARALITKKGYGDYFVHSIGHHLGLETHDVTPSGPLRAGHVITIEPGIYIPDEAIGIRIEDDILVTKDGYRNLSSKLPKTADAIEKLMAR